MEAHPLADRVRALVNNPRVQTAVCDLTACCLIAAAVWTGVQVTRDLSGPFDPDHWRDIAQAQTVRDGSPLADQYYRGEWAWYNPLLAWIVALGSVLTGATVTIVHLRAGPYLNLFGPIGFYVLARRLTGPPAALAALTLYLFFVCGNEPSWAYATYSPWLFTGNLAQGLFYFAALALVAAAESPSRWRVIGAGVLIGLTFLAHTAPAVILAGMACVLLARRPSVLFAMGLTALIVASPFLASIGWHYRFHVVNRAPIVWQFGALVPGQLWVTLKDNGLLIVAGLAGVALIRRHRLAVAAWLVLATILLAYNVFDFGLEHFIPSFHFWLYTTAVLMVLAGVTIAWLCPRPLALVTVVVAATVWNWAIYSHRADLLGGRAGALSRDPNFTLATDYLRRTRRPDDVILGTYGAANLIIGPAGRKVVAPAPVFASPYVEVGSRVANRERMLQAITQHDLPTLVAIARMYDVHTVLTVGKNECAAAESLLRLEWRFGDVCISPLPLDDGSPPDVSKR